MLAMQRLNRLTLSSALLVIGGLLALLVTLWGCVAGIMLDYRQTADVLLGLSFVLPLPLYFVALWSLRWSAGLLVGLYLYQ